MSRDAERPAGEQGPERRRPTRLGVALAILNGTLVGLYPVAIWIGLTHLRTRAVGLIVIAILVPLVVIRLWRAERGAFWAILRMPLAILGLVSLGVVLDDPRYVLALPVLINAVLFVAFALSLRARAIPMIERFARLEDPALDAPKQAHCREFTWVWCGFFVANGLAAALLALCAELSWWATYTGLVSYFLMGLLFSAEYIVRKVRFREYGPWPHDRALARLFPPRR